MKLPHTETAPFKKVMKLVFALGILTNILIVFILIFVNAYPVILSPLIGLFLFITCYFLMVKGHLPVKSAFLIAGYTVALEVVLHTHFLGWDTGFFYYLFALSIIFLLDFSWRVGTVVVFNGSMILLTAILQSLYKGTVATYYISLDVTDNLNFLNQTVVGIVILLIVIFFGYNNKKYSEALQQANSSLEAQNKEISEKRNHLEILLKEVHHRVKNNLQIISSLLSLQSHALEDEEALKVLNKSQNRISAMALIHQNLYSNELGTEVNFKSYINKLIDSQQVLQSEVNYVVDIQTTNLHLDFAVPLGLIVSEMMTNAIKHAFNGVNNPCVNIHLKKNGGEYVLLFKDNGVGLPADFCLENPESLGIEIMVALANQIDADFSFKNENGACFNLTFKLV